MLENTIMQSDTIHYGYTNPNVACQIGMPRIVGCSCSGLN